MFEKYDILEQNEAYIKIIHKTTGDIFYCYPAKCPLCGKDRGIKRPIFLTGAALTAHLKETHLKI
jgi:hypothetical protein